MKTLHSIRVEDSSFAIEADFRRKAAKKRRTPIGVRRMNSLLTVLLRNKRLTVCALAHGGIGFMGSNRDTIQRAIVLVIAVVLTLFHDAFNALVCLALIHLRSLLLYIWVKSVTVKTANKRIRFFYCDWFYCCTDLTFYSRNICICIRNSSPLCYVSHRCEQCCEITTCHIKNDKTLIDTSDCGIWGCLDNGHIPHYGKWFVFCAHVLTP